MENLVCRRHSKMLASMVPLAWLVTGVRLHLDFSQFWAKLPSAMLSFLKTDWEIGLVVMLIISTTHECEA